MNVAITRAKELLIIIGNGRLLQKNDPYWRAFMQFALRNKLFVISSRTSISFDKKTNRRYEGPDLGLDIDANYVSRLEYVTLH